MYDTKTTLYLIFDIRKNVFILQCLHCSIHIPGKNVSKRVYANENKSHCKKITLPKKSSSNYCITKWAQCSTYNGAEHGEKVNKPYKSSNK